MPDPRNRKCRKCRRTKELARNRGGGYRQLCPVCNKDELELYGIGNQNYHYHLT